MSFAIRRGVSFIAVMGRCVVLSSTLNETTRAPLVSGAYTVLLLSRMLGSGTGLAASSGPPIGCWVTPMSTPPERSVSRPLGPEPALTVVLTTLVLAVHRPNTHDEPAWVNSPAPLTDRSGLTIPGQASGAGANVSGVKAACPAAIASSR